jgi:hypothetical protein
MADSFYIPKTYVELHTEDELFNKFAHFYACTACCFAPNGTCSLYPVYDSTYTLHILQMTNCVVFTFIMISKKRYKIEDYTTEH